MLTMLRGYIEYCLNMADFYGENRAHVQTYSTLAYGAVCFFCTLDESFDVTGENKATARTLWEKVYRNQFLELMKRKA